MGKIRPQSRTERTVTPQARDGAAAEGDGGHLEVDREQRQEETMNEVAIHM